MELVHPDDCEATQEAHREWKGKKGPKECINRYRCKDNQYKWLRWDGYYKRGDGTYLVLAKDITQEMAAKVKEELAQKARQVEEVRSEFFANLSHEFKTPLTITLSATQMLESLLEQKVIASQDIVKYVYSIKQNGYRLLRLVNNLIDVTKLDAGYYHPKVKNYNIVNVVEEIVLSVAEYTKDREIIFDTELEEEFIGCDAEMVERIMLNLLSNAIKNTPSHGRIEVMIHMERDAIVIRIGDNGRGIPQAKISYIFERFVQVGDILTRANEGSGIGLALVKSLVELQGGTISVASQEGVGTRFDVRLPRICSLENETIFEPEVTKKRHIEKCYMEFSDIYSI